MLVGTIMTICLSLLGVMVYYNNAHTDEKNDEAAVNLLEYVQEEVILATKMKDGYIRNFQIPQKINSETYTIAVQQNTLTVVFGDKEYLRIIPTISGDMNISNNVIRKINGNVTLN